MKLARWISRNRAELRQAVRAACPNVGPLSLDDLAEWVANDEGLYNWAKGDGVSDL